MAITQFTNKLKFENLIFNRLKIFYGLTLNKIPLFRHLKNKVKFPQLAVHPDTDLAIKGHFLYGKECIINEGCHIIVGAESTLRLGNGCYIGRYVELGPQYIEVGDNTSIQDRCIILGEVEIGRYCIFSLNIYISSGQHHFRTFPHLLIKDQDEFAAHEKGSKKIQIEDDCWIGINAVILPGVHIGKGSVVGANSVVTHDIPPYSVVVGAPAKIISQRLNFKPPTEVHWDREIDLPYFYSGFALRGTERKAHSALAGLAARGKFRLALDGTCKKRIFLTAKSLEGNAEINYHGDKQTLCTEFQDISFSSVDCHFHDFVTDGDCADPTVIIQKAWVA